MNRRGLLKMLGGLPLLGFVRPKAGEVVANGFSQVGPVTVSETITTSASGWFSREALFVTKSEASTFYTRMAFDSGGYRITDA